jgi:alkyldihydroxyacetonephosphate synthase
MSRNTKVVHDEGGYCHDEDHRDESKLLEAVFDRVSELVRNPPSVSPLGGAGADSRGSDQRERLRLYGLYKRVRDGPCCPDNEDGKARLPPIVQPVSRAKYIAWQESSALSQEQAMTEYIQLVSNRSDGLGEESRRLWKEFFDQTHQIAGCTEESDSPNPPVQKATKTTEMKPDTQMSATPGEKKVSPFRSSHRTEFQRLIPRGKLDISNDDLWFAISQCLCQSNNQRNYETLTTDIGRLWQEGAKTGDSCVAVGLSVRSLFDLYLTMKGFPDQSEILVVPPINVPGMMLVAKHHNLRIVPVDIDEAQQQWIDLPSLRSKITNRTVAILQVHPFGMVTTDEESFAQLRAVSDAHGLELWEDCAECFTGLNGHVNEEECCYVGHPQADLRFFSFGPIKTATALGGGIAVFRDTATCQQVERLQYSLYHRQQTQREYLGRVLVAWILNFIASSPIRVGLLSYACQVVGVDFDTLVTSAVRGFRITNSASLSKSLGTNGNGDCWAPELIRQVRRRPSAALLSVLKRRLEQSCRLAPSLPGRINRCKYFRTLLQERLPHLCFPNLGTTVDTCWAFPICCKRDRDAVSRRMQTMGFDVVSGASQLCCVSKFVDKTTNDGNVPCAESLMDSILYLPICSQQLSESQLVDLVGCLQQASTDNLNPLKTEEDRKAPLLVLPYAALLGVIALSHVALIIATRPNEVIDEISEAISCVVCILVCFVLLRLGVEALLRLTTARFYLRESSAFAEYCDMIDAPWSDLEDESTRAEDTAPKNIASKRSNQNVLSNIDALRFSPEHGYHGVATGRKVILTGATGFVGSALLRDLLVHRETLALDCVIVLCRRKGNATAEERIVELLSQPMFSFLSDDEKKSSIKVLTGDVTQPTAGLCSLDQAQIFRDLSISHVFHCAAVVNFNQELPDAARSNITSSLTMQSLTSRLAKKDAIFVHVSTAFVHGDQTGSISSPLPEELFSFEPFDPVAIYKSMLGTQYYASKAMSELRFHNTYSFSKSVCEHVLSRESQVDTIIIRPSIVGPAVENPFEGWAGDRPSTIVAGPCLHLRHQWNFWFLGRQKVVYIPVDVLARFVVAKSFERDPMRTIVGHDTASSSEGSFDHVSRVSDDITENDDVASVASSQELLVRSPRIFNATWDSNSSRTSEFSWLEFSVAYLHLGAVVGYFSRSSAMLQLLVSAQLMPRLVFGYATFKWLHSTLIKSPILAVTAGCRYLGLSNRGLDKLIPYLDLPLLFYPFMKSDFFFQSDLTAPECFDPKRYSFSCGVAAHRFISSRSQDDATVGCQAAAKMSCLVVGGKRSASTNSYFWWAFSQPTGDFLMRLVAASVGYLLGAICTVVTVDVASFRDHIAALKSTKQGQVYLILAPTHRSFLDFILLSFVFFALPELQINLPFIVAADEFQCLPVIGWMARLLGAFYIQRGRKSVDNTLPLRLSDFKTAHLDKSGTCLELFVEGRRSRDRRFVGPKTGFLKCLKESGGEHVILPITISYEVIPEQEILSEEASGSVRRKLNLAGMFCWVKEALLGNVNIGKIHIGASGPLPMACHTDGDFASIVHQIQLKQRTEVRVSDYHVKAASSFFNVDEAMMKATMEKLGCRFWEEIAVVELPLLPTDTSNLFTVVLQFAHLLAPWISGERREWSTWLDSLGACPSADPIPLDENIEGICRILVQHFDMADESVAKAIDTLKAAGFARPQFDHVFQTARSRCNGEVPLIFLNAAVHMKMKRQEENEYTCTDSILDIPNTAISETMERLGFWGFNDSGFVVRINELGEHCVTMRGTRYGICGKAITGLLPFIESALNVRINFSKEFDASSSAWREDFVCGLSIDDQKLLEGMVDGRISISTIDRARHGTGQSQEDIFQLRAGGDIRIPDAVVWPSTETQVKSLVQAARSRRWCLIPFGGGTNVTSATRCPTRVIESRPIISVDMKRMNRILWVNEEDGLANVEAGITGRELVELLERRGYTMGHEPDSIEFSTLGGWIATKASGMKRSKYGNIEDIVVAARIVSSDGVLWNGGDGHTKSVSGRNAEGLDVRAIAIGSEGCLGIITSAVIRIWPLPEAKKYDSVLFPTFDHGLRFLRALSRERQAMPSCVRLLDNSHFQLGRALRPDSSWFDHLKEAMTKLMMSTLYADRFDRERVVCATFTFEGSCVEVRDQIKRITLLARIYGGISLGPNVGKAGYDMTYMIAYLRDFAMTYHILGESLETFAPWSKIEQLISATKDRIVKEHSARLLPGVPFVGCRVTQLYHEGVCLYFYLCISFDGVDRASEVFAELEHAARDEILRNGGSLSHHHGVGKLRTSFMTDRGSAGFRKVASSIKSSIDHDNIFGARNGLFHYSSS